MSYKRKYQRKSSWPWVKQWFLRNDTKIQMIKEINKLDSIKIKNCAASHTIKKNDKITHRMRENICKSYI